MDKLFRDIEDAIYKVKQFRSRDVDSLEIEMLYKVSADTRLIEAVIQSEEMYFEDYGISASFERELLLAKLMGYEVSNRMNENFLYSFNVCDSVAAVGTYFLALVYLADCGLEDSDY